MLGWNEEVPWRGEGLRAQLHGAAAALRPAAHGAGDSWKNFILQTQGIAGNVTSTRRRLTSGLPRDLPGALGSMWPLTGREGLHTPGAGAPQHHRFSPGAG
ncbi:hypothetical protein EYF80_062428 [Liparis tanakae]|uniref:Uncharacterized protein n=1 Tax=Liparis tanakae TaxID=230148 RepID=A0A4Z2EFA9_9TELE|nr:hypothetical protein EYF80_062428 [Liparis tanakae]